MSDAATVDAIDVTGFTSAMRAGVDITAAGSGIHSYKPEGRLHCPSPRGSNGAGDWAIHVSDRLGKIHSDPLDIEISRRDAKNTKKLG